MYNQYASLVLPISYAPNWQTIQLTIVAVAAGSISRNVRRKELVERFVRAVSICPARASLMGLSALTKPERMKKSATQA